MAEIKQISLFVENKPGRMAKVSKTLSDAGVNIRALTIAEAGDFGVIRMVVDDPEKGYKVLKENGFTVSTTDVLAVEMKDTPGGLYEIVNTLGENGVNVDYAYAFVTAKAQRAMLILRVDDIVKARKVLSDMGVKIATREEIQAVFRTLAGRSQHLPGGGGADPPHRSRQGRGDRPRGAGAGEARRASLRVPAYLPARAVARGIPLAPIFPPVVAPGPRRNPLQSPAPFSILCFHPGSSMCAHGSWTSPVVRRG